MPQKKLKVGAQENDKLDSVLPEQETLSKTVSKENVEEGSAKAEVEANPPKPSKKRKASDKKSIDNQEQPADAEEKAAPAKKEPADAEEKAAPAKKEPADAEEKVAPVKKEPAAEEKVAPVKKEPAAAEEKVAPAKKEPEVEALLEEKKTTQAELDKVKQELEEVKKKLNAAHQTAAVQEQSTTVEESEEEIQTKKVASIDNQVALNEKETELTGSETTRFEAIQNKKAAQRQAIKDLLESIGGNIPTMEENEELRSLMKVNDKLAFDEIAMDNDFEAYRKPTFGNDYPVDDATDFFTMDIPQQEMLYDRIGLFKGVVVDYTKENKIEQGYRDVVKHIVKSKKNNDIRSKPVRVFYKKPRLSGFYETTYALDETQKKSQESGIFNFGFGLSVSYNAMVTSAAVKGGYSYGKESFSEKNSHIKRISIISSFFLPKIELSFDALQPCAADDLIVYLEDAFKKEKDNPVACFDRVNTILMTYGQFLPTSLVIGGRIYHSDTHEVKTDESVENVMTKHAGELKAAYSKATVEVGVEIKVSNEDSSKKAEKSTAESKAANFNAIGGEGAFVADMDKWVASTSDSKGWGLVRFDNLVPVIDVLPESLQKDCINLFNTIINIFSIEDLLSKNAHFLFHKGYYERFGMKVQPKYYTLNNSLGGDSVLSISIDTKLENNQEVKMMPSGDNNAGVQEWYIADSGKIYIKESYNTPAKFVLSIDSSSTPPRLVITQDNYFDNQIWTIRGGIIMNETTGLFLNCKDKSTLVLTNTKSDVKNATWMLNAGSQSANSQQQITAQATNQSQATTSHQTPNIVQKGSSILKNNQSLAVGDTLTSEKGFALLTFTSEKIAIAWGRPSFPKVEIWSKTFNIEKAAKLALVDGLLSILSASGSIITHDILTNIGEANTTLRDIQLLDNGNFEGVDRDGNIVMESGSIIYGMFKHVQSKNLLSLAPIGQSDGKFLPSLSKTKVVVLHNLGTDYQYFYINRNQNIISKYNKKQALYCNDTEIFLEGVSSTDSAQQQWVLHSSGHGSIENRKNKKKIHVLDMGVVVPSDLSTTTWEFVYEENTNFQKKELSLSQSSISTDEDCVYSFTGAEIDNIHNGWIDLQGKEIRAVRIQKYYNRYALKVRLEDGQEVESETWGAECHALPETDNRYPTGAVIYLPQNCAAIRLCNTAGYESKPTNPILFALEAKQKDGIIVKSKGVSSFELNDGDTIQDIDLSWATAPDSEKVVGIAFTKVHKNRLGVALITTKK